MARKRGNPFITIWLVFNDAVVITIALLLAYWIRFYSGLIPIIHGISPLKEYMRVSGYILIILLLVLRSYGLYRSRKRNSRSDEFFSMIKAITVGLFFLMAITFMYREFSFSRSVLLLMYFTSIIGLAVSRLFISQFEFWWRRFRGENKKLLIIGTGEKSKKIVETIQRNPHLGYEIIGFLSSDSKNPSQKYFLGMHVLGSLNDLAGVISGGWVDEVILTTSDLSRQKVVDIILECEKEMASFKLAVDILGMVTSQVDMDNLGGIPLLGLKDIPLDEAGNRIIKRTMDIVCTSSGLIILSPLFLLIAIMVKSDSKGPAVYKQERVGEDGKGFMIYKFRTMPVGAEKTSGPVKTTKNDPRKTRSGAFLRRYNLDELPQLWNVLKGDMSLAGPRPERPYFVAQHKMDIPRYMSRHRVKSGMTGWAQVNGLRGDTPIEERTKYDLYYIENWSLLFDVKILIISLFAIENAY